MFTTGVLVTSWLKTPTVESAYCETALPCRDTESPLFTPGIHVVPPS